MMFLGRVLLQLVFLALAVTAKEALTSEEVEARLNEGAAALEAEDTDTAAEWQVMQMRRAHEAFEAQQLLEKFQLEQEDVRRELEAKRQESEGNSIESKRLFQAVLAATEDNMEDLRNVLQSGVGVDRVNRNGETALHAACTRGEAAVVELLLKAGADPNARANRALSEEDMTPLSWCVLAGSYDATEVLLDTKKTDVNMHFVVRQFDNKRQTALDLAKSRHNEDMVALLLEYKAKSYEELEEREGGTMEQRVDTVIPDEDAFHRFLNLEA